MRPDSQPARLLEWLRANPGASGMEIVTALRMPKYTGRISDLRAAGYVVDVAKDKAGVNRYTVSEQVTPRHLRETFGLPPLPEPEPLVDEGETVPLW